MKTPASRPKAFWIVEKRGELPPYAAFETEEEAKHYAFAGAGFGGIEPHRYLGPIAVPTETRWRAMTKAAVARAKRAWQAARRRATNASAKRARAR